MAKRVLEVARELGLHPKEILAIAKQLGIAHAKVVASFLEDSDIRRIAATLNEAKIRQMKPDLKGRKLVEVPATISWEATMRHRVYTCPATADHDYLSGATALVLKNRQYGTRIPLEVCVTTELATEELANLGGVSEPFRERARQYLAAVRTNERIIHPGRSHRFYFLSTEPWPDEMQQRTSPAATPPTEWSAILSICTEPDHFFRWPQVGTLLWPGCVRKQNDGEHEYPDEIILYLGRLGLKPDTRTNGPAIRSFLAAGGKRPTWGNEGWPIHHIFDGTDGSPHAASDGNLFTHSAGLVAAHPVAHYLAHQSSLLKWLLWREAFLRFGFDPMGLFKDT